MTKANAVKQRVILLATNSSQSIIGESVEGTINTIGYSAYGEQSAQQEVASALGFNGQLREAKLGWYLLGNGYRAYNTRLMRFHSPDSWSPFDEGGLNSYAYCLNDPINSDDPTGHSPTKRLLKRFLAKKAAIDTVQNTNALQPKRLSVIVKNPNHPSSKITQLATERNLAPPKTQSPIAEPIAAPKSPSRTIKNIVTDTTPPSIPPFQPMISAAHSQAGMLQEMPRLKSMIDIFQKPLVRGKRKMPTLSISATEDRIKNMPQFNPVVLVRRS